MLNEIEAPLVQEIVVGETPKRLCLKTPSTVIGAPSRWLPFAAIECQNEFGHEHSAHVSNPYYNIETRRHESYVWGFDDNGFSFSYAIDLDSLEEQDDAKYTMEELVAKLGDTDGDPWSA